MIFTSTKSLNGFMSDFFFHVYCVAHHAIRILDIFINYSINKRIFLKNKNKKFGTNG